MSEMRILIPIHVADSYSIVARAIPQFFSALARNPRKLVFIYRRAEKKVLSIIGIESFRLPTKNKKQNLEYRLKSS